MTSSGEVTMIIFAFMTDEQDYLNTFWKKQVNPVNKQKGSGLFVWADNQSDSFCCNKTVKQQFQIVVTTAN